MTQYYELRSNDQIAYVSVNDAQFHEENYETFSSSDPNLYYENKYDENDVSTLVTAPSIDGGMVGEQFEEGYWGDVFRYTKRRTVEECPESGDRLS